MVVREGENSIDPVAGRIRGMVAGEGGRSTGVLLYLAKAQFSVFC